MAKSTHPGKVNPFWQSQPIQGKSSHPGKFSPPWKSQPILVKSSHPGTVNPSCVKPTHGPRPKGPSPCAQAHGPRPMGPGLWAQAHGTRSKGLGPWDQVHQSYVFYRIYVQKADTQAALSQTDSAVLRPSHAATAPLQLQGGATPRQRRNTASYAIRFKASINTLWRSAFRPISCATLANSFRISRPVLGI